MRNLTGNRNIVLEVTYECNLACKYCDRWCNLVPTHNDSSRMSIEQVQYFTKEIITNQYSFRILKFSGGEATLHPDLLLMLETVKPILDNKLCTEVSLLTNGIMTEKLKDIPKWVSIVNTRKGKQQTNLLIPHGMAPIELGIEVTSKNNDCCHIFNCSLCLNKWGFYLSGTCGSLDRFVGENVGVKSLKEIIDTKFKVIENQQNRLCKYCGFSYYVRKTDYKNSIFYKKAKERYDKKGIILTAYGDPDL